MGTKLASTAAKKDFAQTTLAKWPWFHDLIQKYNIKKWHLGAGGAILVFLLVFGIYSVMTPAQGNPLYGLCRAYVEAQAPIPRFVRVLTVESRVPEDEPNPNNPQRMDFLLTINYLGQMGENIVQTVTCRFQFKPELVGTPWQGFLLSQVFVDGRTTHGWADTYVPPGSPQAAQDKNNRLEKFFAAVPSLLADPVDLSLPPINIYYRKIEDYKDLLP